MRRLPLFFPLLAFVVCFTVSCKMRPEQDLGDTIPESVFWPQQPKPRPVAKVAVVRDSADIFYVGDGSTPALLQLVSYPSRRDTIMAGKRKPLHVKGNADYGHVIRVAWHRRSATDSVVSSVEEIHPDSIS